MFTCSAITEGGTAMAPHNRSKRPLKSHALAEDLPMSETAPKTRPASRRRPSQKKPHQLPATGNGGGSVRGPVTAPSPNNTYPMPANAPHFAEPAATPDPAKFTVKHGSDSKAYSVLDSERATLKPRPFPVLQGTDEPLVELSDALGAA